MIGLFEPEAAAWNVKKIPENEHFSVLPPDWERMTPFLQKAMERVPITLETGIKTFFCGPESFTPDLSPILGEVPEIRNYFVAAGMNSVGILSGGGVGKLMAHWITKNYSDMDVTGVNVDRFQKYQISEKYRADRVVESLGMVYKCHYPSHALKTARNCKELPLSSFWRKERAYFVETSGWEAPSWFPRSPETKNFVEEDKRMGWNHRENWWADWEEEHRACRENVGLIDMSFMSKFMVQGNLDSCPMFFGSKCLYLKLFCNTKGKGAGKLLNYLTTSNILQKETITYTQLLNSRGTMEGDVTVLQLSDERFLVVATDTAYRHVQTILQREFENQTHPDFFYYDQTGSLAQLSIVGPNSRNFLKPLVDIDLDHEAFPYRSCKSCFLGVAPITIARMNYVGELGYELYIPVEYSVHVYEAIQSHNHQHQHQLRLVGLKALSSLRLEKGYRDYGHDMDNTDSVREVGLEWNCDFGKPFGFRGKESVQKAMKPTLKKLISVLGISLFESISLFF